MALTKSQLYWLAWLDKNGGRAFVQRSRLVANGANSNVSAALPFLTLVVKGYVEVANDTLVISEKGRAMVNPFYQQRQFAAPEETMSIRAKMVLQSKDNNRAVFHTQYDPKINEEDAGFTKATPSGNAEFVIDNPKAIDQLEPGKAYYFDISPAD